MKSKEFENAAFSQRNCHISFQLSQSNSGPDRKSWSDLHSRTKPISTEFAIVQIQPIQVQSNAHFC